MNIYIYEIEFLGIWERERGHFQVPQAFFYYFFIRLVNLQ